MYKQILLAVVLLFSSSAASFPVVTNGKAEDVILTNNKP